MVNFREKWLTPLLLAILLHVLVFFILYINFNKKTIDNSVSDNKNTEITTPISLDKVYPPLQTQTDTSTSNAIKNTVTDERSLDKASSPQTTAKPETPKDVTTDYKKTEKINNSNNKTLKSTAGIVIADNQIIEFNPNVPENTEAVSVAINNAGLLGMDTPAQNTFGKTNKEYDSAKSDLEQTNNQLSEAINEVKKRNQQKIDELHEQSPYPEESNDIFK